MGAQCVNQTTLCVCCSGTEVQNWLIILKKIENYPVLLWMLWAGLSLVHCKINLSQTKVGLQFSISGWDVHVGLPGSPPILHNPLFYRYPTPGHCTVTIILFLTCIIVKLVYLLITWFFFPDSECPHAKRQSDTVAPGVWICGVHGRRRCRLRNQNNEHD